ncbi:MAG: tandem-95 repeat protein, partial [Planctomycetota bacterium]|nr:tandem-95 repeat protein [Planctomycetota bacterium]
MTDRQRSFWQTLFRRHRKKNRAIRQAHQRFFLRPLTERLEDRRVLAAVVFVDDDWVGLSNGDDPDGAGPRQEIGLDAHRTIEEGVTAVDAGGTVNIAAGTYIPDDSLEGSVNDNQSPIAPIPTPVRIKIPTAKSNITLDGEPGTVIDMSSLSDTLLIPGFEIAGLQPFNKLLFGVDGPGFTLQDIEVINPLRVVVAGSTGGDDSTPFANNLTIQNVTVTYADNGGLPSVTSRGLVATRTFVFDQNNVGFEIAHTTGLQILNNTIDSSAASVGPSLEAIELRGHFDGALIQGNTIINYADAIVSNNFGGGSAEFNSFNMQFLDNNITMPGAAAGEFFEGGIVLVGVEDSVVSGNTITTSSGFSPDAGIYVATRNTSNTDNITIEDNTISNMRWGVTLQEDFKDTTYTNISITGNTFNNSGGTADAAGIYIDLAEQAAMTGGSSITITDNNITNSPTGVFIAGDTATISLGNISGNTVGVDATTASSPVDARFNFWGDPSGPSGDAVDPNTPAVASGSGDSIVPGSGGLQVRFDEILLVNPVGGLTIQGTAGDDLLIISATSTDDGTYTLVSDGVVGPVVPFSDIQSLSFVGFDGDDILRINNPAGGLFSPVNGIGFDGGAQADDVANNPPGDAIEILDGTATTTTFNYENANDGSINLDGTSTIEYRNLEPITSTITATNVTLNYSTTAETITVTDAGGGQTRVNSTDGETTAFDNPSTTLTINGGDTGADSINVNGFGTGFAAALVIDGQGGSDTVTLNTDPDNASVTVTAETINIDGGAVTTTGDQTYNGAVILGADVTLTDTGSTGIFFNNTVDSDDGANTPRDLTVVTTDSNAEIEFNDAVGGMEVLDQVTITNAGLLVINALADFSLDGAFNQNGAGAVETSGDITTTNDAISFSGAVKLTANVALNTDTGAGNITFSSTLNDDGTTSNRDLDLTAGTGNVTFTGAVGGTQGLDAVTINSATNVTITSTFKAESFSQTAGTGETEINGDVTITDDTATAGVFKVNTANIDINANITTDARNVDLDATTSVDLATGKSITTRDNNSTQRKLNSGSVDIDISAAGAVNLVGSIVTTGANNTFGTSFDGGQVTIDTFDGGITVGGGITTSGGSNDFNTTGGTAGSIAINAGDDGNSGGDDININGALTARGGASAGTSGSGGAGNSISIITDDGLISVTAAIISSGGSGSVGVSNGGNAGSITITSGDANTTGTDTITIGAALSAVGGSPTLSGNGGNNADITISSADALAIQAPIAGGSNSATAINIDAAGNITSTAAGTITTTAPVNNLNASGGVDIDAAGTGLIDLDGAIITTGQTQSLSGGSAGGNVNISTIDGDITIDAAITTTGGGTTDATLLAGNAGNITIAAGDAGGSGADDVNVNAALTGLGGNSTVGSGAAGNGSVVSITTTDGLISIAAAIITSGGNGTASTSNGGNAGTITITSADANTTGTDTVTIGGALTAKGGTSAGGTGGDNADMDITAAASLAINAAIMGGQNATTGIDLNAVTGITSNASGDITTTAVANSGNTSGGVDIDSTAGTIVLSGSITTTGAAHDAGTGSAGGQVTIDTTNGLITVNAGATITTSGGAATTTANNGGNAGQVIIQSAGTGDDDDVTIGAAISALGGADFDTGTAGANGNVKIASQDDLFLNAAISGGSTTVAMGTTGIDLDAGETFVSNAAGLITTTATADGTNAATASGPVAIDTANGLITIGAAIVTSGVAGPSGDSPGGNAGTISITSANGAGTDDGITLNGALTALGGSPNGAGTAGVNADISVTTADTLAVNAAISGGANATTGVDLEAGGNITSNASGDITTTALVNSSNASGGVDIDSTAGTIDLDGDIITTGADRNASPANNGGQVTIDTANGSITIDGVITTSGGAATAGNSNGGDAATIAITAADGAGTDDGITINGALTAKAGLASGSGVSGQNHDIAITTADALLIQAAMMGGRNTTTGIDLIGSSVTTSGAGTITTTGPVNTDLRPSGGIDIDATRAIDLNGAITTTGAARNAGNGNAGGQVTINSTTAGQIDIDGGITTTGGATSEGTSTGGVGGSVTIGTTDGLINVTTAITTSGGAGTAGMDGGGNAGTISITSGGGAGDNITLTGALTAQGGVESGTGTAGNNGNITVTSAGTLAVNAAIKGGQNTTTGIDLAAATGITSDASGTITTTAVVNSQTASGGVDIDVTGVGAISLAGAIATTGAGTDSATASAGGQVTIDTFDGAITVTNITTSGGNGTAAITNGGAAGAIAIIVGDDGGGGDHDLTLNGAIIALGGSEGAGGTAGTGGTVELTADDQIIDGSDAATDIQALAAELIAVTGIATGSDPDNRLEVDLTNLAATTASGDISILDVAGGLTITDVNGIIGATATSGVSITAGAVGDDITITAQSPLTVNSPVANAGGGNITQTASGSTDSDDLTINANITATGGTGNITLNAGDDILQTGTAAVSAASSGAVDYNASTGTSDGVITMTNGTTAASGSGVITMDADGDITVSGVSTTAGTAPAAGVRIETTAGAIKDAGDMNTDITAASVALRAETGIGDAGDANGRLETATSGTTLTLAAVTESGDIGLRNTGSLTIGTVDSLVGVVITDATDNNQGDDIIITAASPVTVDDVVTNNDGGDITLAAEAGTAADATDDLDINANITASGGTGSINLYATDGVDVDAAVTIAAASTGNVLVSASTDYNDGTPQNGFTPRDATTFPSDGDVVMQSGSTIQTEDGDITIRGAGDVKLSKVNADSNSNGGDGTVIITADFDGVDTGLSDEVGAITDNLTGETATDINITALNTALRAGSGIGDDANDIDIVSLTGSPHTIAAQTEAGDIVITNRGETIIGTVSDPFSQFADLSGVTILDATATVANQDTADDNIKIISTRDMTVSQAVTNNDGGDITLAAEGGGGGQFQVINTLLGGAGTFTWLQAAADAAARGGYLATITSAAENVLFNTARGGADVWIGASDAAVEGEWRWVQGPEAAADGGQGLLFWTGTSSGTLTAGLFENWGGGEPNNSSDEDYAHASSVWNDLPVTSNLGSYMLEIGNSDLIVNANITATGAATGADGNINLYGANDVIFDDSVGATIDPTVSAAGSGDVLVQAGTDFNDGGTPANGSSIGNIAMGDGSTISTQDGDITLQAPGDISLSKVDADSNNTGPAGTVIVTADFDGVGTGLSNNVGAITDNLSGEGFGSINVAGGAAAFRAPQGIGSANDIDTDLGDDAYQSRANLTALNTLSGNILIDDVGTNSDNLTIGTVNALVGITNRGPGGTVVVSNTSPITTADDVLADGNITITAADDALDDAGATADLVDGGGGLSFSGTTGDGPTVMFASATAMTLSDNVNLTTETGPFLHEATLPAAGTIIDLLLISNSTVTVTFGSAIHNPVFHITDLDNAATLDFGAPISLFNATGEAGATAETTIGGGTTNDVVTATTNDWGGSVTVMGTFTTLTLTLAGDASGIGLGLASGSAVDHVTVNRTDTAGTGFVDVISATGSITINAGDDVNVFGNLTAVGQLIGTDPTNDKTYAINPATGVVTEIGATGTTSVSALGVDATSTTVFGLDQVASDNSDLFSINPSSGVGTKTFDVTPAASDNYTAAAHGSGTTLFAFADDIDSLVSINTTTGVATTLGVVTITATGATVTDIDGMAFDSANSKLFAVDNATDQLLTINTTTGAAVVVGPTGQDLGGLAFDPVGKRLYATDNAGNQLMLVSTVTGAVSAVGGYGGSFQIDGLASRTVSGKITINIDNTSVAGADAEPGTTGTEKLTRGGRVDIDTILDTGTPANSTGVLSTIEGTDIFGGNDNDIFDFFPLATTSFFVQGSAPVFADGNPPVPPGDKLVLQFQYVTAPPTLTVGVPAAGTFTFDPNFPGTPDDEQKVVYESIENVSKVGAQDFHLVVDSTLTTPAPGSYGNDTFDDKIEVRLNDGLGSGDGGVQGEDVIIERTDVGAVPFQDIIIRAAVADILSVTLIGSSDNEELTINANNGVPAFSGTVPESQRRIPNALKEYWYNDFFGDDELDLSGGGGYLGRQTGTSSYLNQDIGGVDSDLSFSGNDFNSRSSGYTGTDAFGAVWIGQIEIGAIGSGSALEAGTISFGTRSNDGSVIYIDSSGNGAFEAGERVVNNTGTRSGSSTQDAVGQVTLAAGTYDIAIAYYDGDDANNTNANNVQSMEARFSGGTVTDYNLLTIIDPTATAQANLWYSPVLDNPHINSDNNGNGGVPNFFWRAEAGTDSLVYTYDQANSGVTNQVYAIGDGYGGGDNTAAGFSEGELQTTIPTQTDPDALTLYFTGLEPITASGDAGGTLTVLGDDDHNTITIADSPTAGNTRITAAKNPIQDGNAIITDVTNDRVLDNGVGTYETYDFAADTFVTLNVFGQQGEDVIDLTSLDANENTLTAINLDGDADDNDDTSQDNLRVRSTSSLPNTSTITLRGGAGNDTFQLFQSTRITDDIDVPIVVSPAGSNATGSGADDETSTSDRTSRSDPRSTFNDDDSTGDRLIIDNSGSTATFPALNITNSNVLDNVTGNTTAADVTFNDIDELTIYRPSTNDTINVNYGGVATFVDADLDRVTLNGSGGNDTFNILSSTPGTGQTTDPFIQLNGDGDRQLRIDGGGNNADDLNDFVDDDRTPTQDTAANGFTGTDQFIYAAGEFVLNGRIDGGAADDTLSYTAYTTTRSILLTALGTIDGFRGDDISGAPPFGPITTDSIVVSDGSGERNFINIDQILGTSANADLLIGPNLFNHWDFGNRTSAAAATDEGVLVASDVSIGDGGNGTSIGRPTGTVPISATGGEQDLLWDDFQHIRGGTSDDHFDFRQDSVLTGMIDGNSGEDTIDLRDFTANVVIDLTTRPATTGQTPIAGTSGTVVLQGTVTQGGNAVVVGHLRRATDLGAVPPNATPADSDSSSIENAFGGHGADTIIGDGDNNILGDGPANDFLYGDDGDDIYRLEPGAVEAGTGASQDVVLENNSGQFPTNANNPHTKTGATGNDTIDFRFADSNTMFDIDHIDTLLDNVNDPQQDVFGTVAGNQFVTIQRVEASTTFASRGNDPVNYVSPFENLVGSQFNDILDIDPLAIGGDFPVNGPPVLRNVDGNSGTDILQFESYGANVFDTGLSVTAAGTGTVTYQSIETLTAFNQTARVIDDGDTSFRMTPTPESVNSQWANVWQDAGTEGNSGDYRAHVGGNFVDHFAEWTFNGVQPGKYRVSATWPGVAADRSQVTPWALLTAIDAPFTVFDDSEKLMTIDVDQNALPSDFLDGGVWWHDLGVFQIDSHTLVTQLGVDANGFVYADSIRIERLSDGPELRVFVDDTIHMTDSSSKVDFSTFIAQPRSKTFTLQNEGTTALSIFGLELFGDTKITLNLPFPTPTAAMPLVIAPGESTFVTVTLDATQHGEFATELRIFSNDVDENVMQKPGAGINPTPDNDTTRDEDPFTVEITGSVVSTFIIDDGDPGFDTTNLATGVWLGPDGDGYLGDDLWTTSDSSGDAATWTFTGLPAGNYRVSATWDDPGSPVIDAPFTIFEGSTGGTNLGTTLMNQQGAPASFSDVGVLWQDLTVGTTTTANGIPVYNISGLALNNTITVQLTDLVASSSIHLVHADAIRIERILDPDITVTELVSGVAIADDTGTFDFGTTFPGVSVEKTFVITNNGPSNNVVIAEPFTLPSGYTLTQVFGGTPTGLASNTATLAPAGTTTFKIRVDAGGAGTAGGEVSFGMVSPDIDPDENPFNFTITSNVSESRIIDDNLTMTGGYSETGTWFGPDGHGYLGDDRWTAADDDGDTATFTFQNLPSGRYEVAATWKPEWNASSATPFAITGDATSNVTVNQRVRPDDFIDQSVAWEILGDVSTSTGQITVVLSDNATGLVHADAVQVRLLSQTEIEVLDGTTVLTDGQSAVNFGSTTPIGSDLNRTFTVRNYGSRAMPVSSLSLPPGFVQIGVFPSSVPAASGGNPGSASFTVRLPRNTVGEFAGTLSFAADDRDENPFDFAISGHVSSTFTTIKDDGDAGYSTSGAGWFRVSNSNSYNGDLDFTRDRNSDVMKAFWEFTGLADGVYRVSATWDVAQLNNATYRVIEGTATTGTAVGQIVIDQAIAPNDLIADGFTWEDLGGPYRVNGGTLTVELSSMFGVVIADAIRIEPVSAPEIQVLDEASNELLDGTGLFDFGTTPAGTTVPKTFTVRNLGNASLTLTAGSITLPEGFSLASDFAATTLTAFDGVNTTNDETTFQVTFDADTTPGAVASGLLSFTNSDRNEANFSFSVQGTVASTVQTLDDSAASGFQQTGFLPQTWQGFGGNHHSALPDLNNSTSNEATWTFTGLATGWYQVATHWREHGSLATDAPFSIYDGDVTTGTLRRATDVNQRLRPGDFQDQGAMWEELGAVFIASGTLTVRLTDDATDGLVVADTMRIERLLNPEIEVLDGTTTIDDNTGTLNLGTTLQQSEIRKTITIRNSGGADLGIGHTLTLPPAFSLVTSSTTPATLFNGTAITTLTPGSTATFDVELAASALGTFSGLASFMSTDSDESHYNFTLTGTVTQTTIIDDVDSGFAKTTGFLGSVEAGFGPHINNSIQSAAGDGSGDTATWTFTNLQAGETYRVSVTWPANEHYATNSPFSVFDGTAGGTAFGGSPFAIDQQVLPDDFSDQGVFWEQLGTFAVTGNTLTVQLTDTANGVVVADAVRISILSPLRAAEIGKAEQIANLTLQQIAPVLVAAADQWIQVNPLAAGILNRIEVKLADLSGNYLGLTSLATQTIWIDTDAAGHGWWTDVAEDPESGMDLLTVLTHELGNLLGYLDLPADADHILAAALPAETRRLVPGFEGPLLVVHTPIGTDDVAEVAEDKGTTINVLGNDTDVDGDIVGIQSFEQPSNAVVTEVDGQLQITPAANFHGVISFNYIIVDEHGLQGTATTQLTVLPVNDAPLAVADVAEVLEDEAVTVNVLANDSDVDGDRLAIASFEQPNDAVVSEVAGGLQIEPADDFFGVIRFNYILVDEHGLQSTASVEVTVLPTDDAPLAIDDAVEVAEDQTITVDVLSNDPVVDGDLQGIESFEQPSNAVVTEVDGQLHIAPVTDFHGVIHFNYTLVDEQGERATATVEVTVLSVNDAPLAVADAAEVAEDQAIIVNVLGNDLDADGDVLSIVSFEQPSNAVVTEVDGQLRVEPAANFHGVIHFNYTTVDAQGEQSTATVEVTVLSVNDTPLAVADVAEMAEDQAIIVNVLGNDLDADGDVLSIVSFEQPSNAVVTEVDGQLRVEPVANFHGVINFSYTTIDGQGGQSTATVEVTVLSVNDAPLAVADAAEVAEDTPITINVLGNDTDVDGDVLSIVSFEQPDNAVV